MSENDNSLTQNRSKLREFLASIATIRGDLSNITAPPFILDTKSVVELPAYWAEHPSVFVAPASSEDPAKRALLVLRWFLASLRNQQYAGHTEEEGVKKPLNAFLGELFLAHWEDDCGITRLISEQVSHHPPVTACRVWNEKHGISAEGYTAQKITFTGTVNIQQIGHAKYHIAKYDETYLIPLPNVKVKGILSGTAYPEIQGQYLIPSTNGYISSIDFSGKGWLSRTEKHSFEAKVYQRWSEDEPVYTIKGNWNGEFTIHDVKSGEDIETYNIESAKPTSLITDPLDQQDQWETRRAWHDVISALKRGDMQGTSDAKSKVEQGQRNMRKEEEKEGGKKWQRLFFKNVEEDVLAAQLAEVISQKSDPDDTAGLWVFDLERFGKGLLERPFHAGLTPDNVPEERKHEKDSGVGMAVGEEQHKDENRGNEYVAEESVVGVSAIGAGVAGLFGAGKLANHKSEPENHQPPHQQQQQEEARIKPHEYFQQATKHEERNQSRYDNIEYPSQPQSQRDNVPSDNKQYQHQTPGESMHQEHIQPRQENLQYQHQSEPQRGNLQHENIQRSSQSQLQHPSQSPSQSQSQQQVVQQDENNKVHPVMSQEEQKREVEESKLEPDVGRLSLQEQRAVEEMLRDQYSTKKKKRKSRGQSISQT